VKSIVLLLFVSTVITNGIAMQEQSDTKNKHVLCKKRKQPEPTCLSENTAPPTPPFEVPFQLPILHGLFCFQYEKSQYTNSSVCVLEYQLFVRNQDGITYTSRNFVTLTLKNLHAPYITITVNSNSQNQEAAHHLENHTWNTSVARRDNTLFEIITKELKKEFYILRCISFIQPDKPLICWNPKGCVLQNSFHLTNKTLILQPSLVLLKCGHYFHQKCLPVNFRETVDGCPVCKTLIKDADDFFVCDTTLPKITITAL
jgi:hypothetical protein